MKDFDKRLKKLEAKVNNAEFYERVREVERIVDTMIEEYNSEQERQKRAAEYKEIQRIGELRKQAYKNGESMDKYPLPFEKSDYKLPEELQRFLPKTGIYQEKE